MPLWRPPSRGWVHHDSWAHSAGVTSVDFADLAKYNSLYVSLRGVSLDGAGWRFARVSVDGGNTFLSTSGDYVTTNSNGVDTNSSSLILQFEETTAARSGSLFILHNLLGVPKIANRPVASQASRIMTNSIIDAIRLYFQGSGGNRLSTAGAIDIFGELL